MYLLSRRNFLKGTIASLALLSAGGLLREMGKKRELFLINATNGVMPPQGTAGVYVTPPGFVHAFDVTSATQSSIDLPFTGHIPTQHPSDPKRVFTFEKWGMRGALIDLEQKKMVADIPASAGNIFFGHAAFISNGSILVASEDQYDRSSGQLVLRDIADLRVVGKLSTYGMRPHECRAIDHGRTLVAVNEGNGVDEPSSVVWIEAASGKLLRKVVLDVEKGAPYSHIALRDDGWCFIGGPNFTGRDYMPAVVVSPEGNVFALERPPLPKDTKCDGEILSVDFIENSDWVAGTMPELNAVFIWNYKTQKHVGTISLPSPRGLLTQHAGTQPRFLVTSAKARHLIQVGLADPASPTITEVYQGFSGSGSHLAHIYI